MIFTNTQPWYQYQDPILVLLLLYIPDYYYCYYYYYFYSGCTDP